MGKDYKTLICCIAKLENYYIREWVEWYKNIGVTNICLYDNNDIDGEHFEDVIGDYIDSGFVIVKDVRGMSQMQLPCYQNCYDEYKDVYDWFGFFDADEYLELENGSINDFLKREEFKDVGAIRVCWKNFDDNDLLIVEDNNYSINRFNRVVNPEDVCNRITKTLVRGGQNELKIYQEPGGAHGQYLNCKTVDCYGNLCDNEKIFLDNRIWDIAWLCHYRFKTIEEYLYLKLDRLYPDVDKITAKRWLDIDSFFGYNKKTPEKVKMWEDFMRRNKIGCFIFNYNKDKNAKNWYEFLKNYYPSYILDTFHKENDSHFNVEKSEVVLEYDNILVGGLTKKAYEIAKKEGYKWVMIINSDVECDTCNLHSLISVSEEILTRNDIGVWEPSAVIGSMLNGCVSRINENKHLYYQGTNNMREVRSGEGWFEFVSIEVMDKVMPYVDYEENKYGWGINDAFNRASRKMGLKVVIDDRVTMYHPYGTGYNNYEASQEYERFKLRFKEMGLEEEEKMVDTTLMTLLCCIGKNENRYIREFVKYYRQLGVTHIRIYDNNDVDGEHFEDVLGDFIDSGYVSLVNYRGRKVCQLDAYNECYKELGDYYDWVMYFDIDEFMFLNNDNNVSDYLSRKEFNDFDMIHINWLLFGDDEQLTDDGRDVLYRIINHLDVNQTTSYTFPDTFHVKSIVRGGLSNVEWTQTSHTPVSGLRCCNGYGEPCDGDSPFTPYDFRHSGLRHFTTKTAEEYAMKIERGFPDGNSITKQQLIELFFKRNKITPEKIAIFKERNGIDVSYLLPYDGVKNEDVKIYSLCYEKKDFQFLEDSVITPLQVGADNGTDVCELKDNTGDNISGENYFFIENTGIYWIWKNVKSKYKGQMQYRRPLDGVADTMDFEDIFSKYDVITCEPFHHPSHKVPTKEEPMIIDADTVEQGYAFSHCPDDLFILEMVIKMYHPEYAEDYDKFIKNGPNLYYSNGFIMRAEDYDRYCEFLFNCLEGYLKMSNITNKDELYAHVQYNIEAGKYIRYGNGSAPIEAIRWQTSIGGFLSERLWTLWLQHNFNDEKILKLPYIKMEDNMYT